MLSPRESTNTPGRAIAQQDSEPEIFDLSTRDMAGLRRELAGDSKDFILYPFGPSLLGGDEREGIVTPDMFDGVMGAAQWDLEADYPGTGSVYGFANLYTPYRELERDTKVSAALASRVIISIERDWEVTPGGEDDIDQQAADMVNAHLMALDTQQSPLLENAVLSEASSFDQMQANAFDALLMGFSASEVLWNKDGKEVYPQEVKFKKQHRWNMYLGANGWEPRLLTRSDRTLGTPVPPRKFLFFRHRPKYGPFGRGLGHELYFPVAYKRRNLELFLVHGQRYAAPTIFIEVPPNASDAIVEAARAAVEQVGMEAVITIPQGLKVITVEGKVGNNNTYKELLAYLDAQISQVVLGQTGTLDQTSDGGSRAQDEVADLQTLRIAKRDSDLYCSYLSRTLISWIVNHNLPGAKVPVLRRLFPELEKSEDSLHKAERDKVLVELSGLRLKREFLEARHEVEFEDEAIALQPTAQPSEQPAPELSEKNTVSETGDQVHKHKPTELTEPEVSMPGSEDRWSDLAMVELGLSLKSFKERVRAAVQQADTSDQLDGALLTLLQADGIREEMASAIAPALSVAYGEGQLDVEEELGNDAALYFAEGLDPVMGFGAAIEAIGAKIPIGTARWDELKGEDQRWAFTVAGIMQADALESIQESVKRSLEGGIGYREFKTSFDEAYSRTGADPLKPWRARLVLNQNVKNSYQAGRYERQNDPEFQRIAPYKRYAHGYSDTPRPGHLALDGFVARADDPVWESIYPPNGFNCSCRVFTLTQGQFERGKYELSDRLPGVGNERFVELPNSGFRVPVADEGFDRAPMRVKNREDAIAVAKTRLSSDKVRLLDEWLAGKGELPKPKATDEGDDEFKFDPSEVGDGADEGEDSFDDLFSDDEEDPFGGLDDVADVAVEEPPVEVPAPSVDKVSTKTFTEHQAHARKVYAAEYKKLDALDNVSDAKLQEKYDRARDNLALNPKQRAAQQRFKNATQALQAAKNKTNQQRLEVFESLRQKMLGRGDAAAAKAWASSMTVTESAIDLYGEDTLRKTLEEFHLMTKGKANNLQRVAYEGFGGAGNKERAYAHRGAQVLNVGLHLQPTIDGGKSDVPDIFAMRTTLFHELGHHVEYGGRTGTLRYGPASEAWRDARVSTMEQVKLRDITGVAGYGDSEVARPGDFYDAYLGKVYQAGSTEVISLGLEHFSDPELMEALYKKQPDLFDYVLGIAEDDN